MKPLFFLAHIAVILSLISCSAMPPPKPEALHPGDYSYLKTYLSWLIEKEMSKQDVTGLSIVVVDDQKVVWSQGFGYADKANNIPATPETLYRVGSVSKLFTDTLVMQLAEQGKLDIDKPLQTYLPDFSIKTRFPYAGSITPRNIMTHHSGLPGDIGQGMWTQHPKPFQQLVGQLKEEYVAYPPNTIWSYSNLGISLLGTMLERVSNTDFNTYAEQQLLHPLGMANAHFSLALTGKNASKAYKGHEEKPEVPLRDMPAGGLNANVLDMSRFIKMVFADGNANGRQILKADTLKAMLRAQNNDVALDAGFRIGLGWLLRDNLKIGTIAEHGGATLYHRSQLSLLPGHKLGVMISTNSPPSGDLLSKITDAALKLAFNAKTGSQACPLKPNQSSDITRPLTTREQQQSAGQYATQFGYVKLTPDGDRLLSEIDNHSFDFVARADGRLGLRYRLFDFIPIEPEDAKEISFSLKSISGHELVLLHNQDQTFVAGEKIKPTPIPASAKQWLGDYEIMNLAPGEAMVPQDCALREIDGFLMMEYSLPEFGVKHIRVPMTALSEQEALSLGVGRGFRETLRLVKRNGENLIAYSGYLLRKLNHNTETQWLN
jgi:CubicO group peptidase (beta-lactamase class C family)